MPSNQLFGAITIAPCCGEHERCEPIHVVDIWVSMSRDERGNSIVAAKNCRPDQWRCAGEIAARDIPQPLKQVLQWFRPKTYAPGATIRHINCELAVAKIPHADQARDITQT